MRERLTAVAATTALGALLASLAWGCGPDATARERDASSPADSVKSAETVVFVHGLGRTAASLYVLADRVAEAGFRVVHVEYPSTREPIEGLVDGVRTLVEACCPEQAADVHFVTHSMGGIVLRAYLARHSPEHRGRVVMLSPPNQGSEVIDAFSASPLLEVIVGPAGTRLGTDSTSLPNQLGPAHFDLGILTGARSANPVTSALIPGPDDGKVAVDRAWLDGALAFKVVPFGHTFLMNEPAVAEETIHFLRFARFR